MACEFAEIRLGDLVSRGTLVISDGYRVRNEELGPEGIPFVRGGDIGDGWINTDTVDHIRPEFADRVRAKLTRPGDVAFITKGTVGRAGRLRAGQPQVVFAPQVAYWRVKDLEALDPGFLFYLIRGRDFQSALYGVKTHGSMVADYVSISQQHDFSFRVPDIASQRAIAHILGTLDDKIELNRTMNGTLETIARALFHRFFVDPVQAGNLSDWKAGELRDLCDRVIEKVVAMPNWANDPLIDLARMPKKSVALTDWGHGEELSSSVTRFQTRDTLFGAIRPYFHKTGVAPVNGVTNISVFVMRAKRTSDWPFIATLCSQADTVHYASRVSKGTKMPVVSWPDLSAMETVIPPVRERDRYCKVAAPLYERIIANVHESRTLAALRDALLPKLLSGEIRLKLKTESSQEVPCA